jgi:hypothetical protein
MASLTTASFSHQPIAYSGRNVLNSFLPLITALLDLVINLIDILYNLSVVWEAKMRFKAVIVFSSNIIFHLLLIYIILRLLIHIILHLLIHIINHHMRL